MGSGASTAAGPTGNPDSSLVDRKTASSRLENPVEGAAAELDQIPTSDLGESLDAKRLRQLLPKSPIREARISTCNGVLSFPRGDIPKSPSPYSSSWKSEESRVSSSWKSEESSDSGIYDLDDDYSFVITETSSPEKVRRVEEDFTPVENIDLTITGKACPRLLSGSQRVRQQEQEILESLREEGFIASSKQRAGGGLAFEIVESTAQTESAGGKIKPQDFLPKGCKEHLEAQRNKHHLLNLTSADLERRQFLAEERRRLEMETKMGKISSQTSSNSIQGKVEELKKKKDEKDLAALEKREAHLRDLRDRLKAQNKKAQRIKLKKLINGPPVPVPIPFGTDSWDADDDEFFRE